MDSEHLIIVLDARRSVYAASDFSATAIDLGALIHKISGLSLKGDNARPSWENVQLEESAEPVTTPVEKSDQNNWLVWAKEVFGDVSRLVQIRRVDQTQLPKLENSQRFLAYENLRLQLLAGQLALLQRDQGLFELSIQQSRVWLIKYFEESEDLGIDDSQADLIGKMAEVDPSSGTNPILFDASQYQSVFMNALNGNLS